MTLTKKCKQCGRALPYDKYRKYAKGSGYHTVCAECENFNQLVNYTYRKPEEERTQAQIELLDKAKRLYETLYARGLEPKGRYAADVLGTTIASGRSGNDFDDYFKELLDE